MQAYKYTLPDDLLLSQQLPCSTDDTLAGNSTVNLASADTAVIEQQQHQGLLGVIVVARGTTIPALALEETIPGSDEPRSLFPTDHAEGVGVEL